MNILAAPTQSAAEAYERRAWEFCRAEGNKGGRWSEIFTDGVLFGIVWDAGIAATFTNDELAGVMDVEDWIPVGHPLGESPSESPSEISPEIV